MVSGGFLSWVRANDRETIDKLEAQSADLLNKNCKLFHADKRT